MEIFHLDVEVSVVTVLGQFFRIRSRYLGLRR